MVQSLKLTLWCTVFTSCKGKEEVWSWELGDNNICSQATIEMGTHFLEGENACWGLLPKGSAAPGLYLYSMCRERHLRWECNCSHVKKDGYTNTQNPLLHASSDPVGRHLPQITAGARVVEAVWGGCHWARKPGGRWQGFVGARQDATHLSYVSRTVGWVQALVVCGATQTSSLCFVKWTFHHWRSVGRSDLTGSRTLLFFSSDFVPLTDPIMSVTDRILWLFYEEGAVWLWGQITEIGLCCPSLMRYRGVFRSIRSSCSSLQWCSVLICLLTSPPCFPLRLCDIWPAGGNCVVITCCCLSDASCEKLHVGLSQGLVGD